MSAKNHFPAIFIIAILFSSTLWMAACAQTPALVVPEDAPPVINSTGVDAVVQPEAEVSVSDTTQPSVVLPEASLDGPSVIANRCTQCHLFEQYAQMNKSRSEWELILAQMESLGLKMSESEKIVLLDYLTTSDPP